MVYRLKWLICLSMISYCVHWYNHKQRVAMFLQAVTNVPLDKISHKNLVQWTFNTFLINCSNHIYNLFTIKMNICVYGVAHFKNKSIEIKIKNWWHLFSKCLINRPSYFGQNDPPTCNHTTRNHPRPPDRNQPTPEITHPRPKNNPSATGNHSSATGNHPPATEIHPSATEIIIHPPPEIIHPRPEIIYSPPEITHLRPEIIHPRPEINHSPPEITHLRPEIIHPRPKLIHPTPEITHLRPKIIHPRLERTEVINPQLEDNVQIVRD